MTLRLSSTGTTKIDLSLQSLSITNGLNHASHAQRLDRVDAMLIQLLSRDKAGGPPRAGPCPPIEQDTQPSGDATPTVASPARIPVQPNEEHDHILLPLTQSQCRPCTATCICCCHGRRRSGKAKILLQYLFTGYVGQPNLTDTCNVESCTRRGLPTVTVAFYFPRWFVQRAAVVTLSGGSAPSIALSLPRIIPGNALIFRWIENGDCRRVHEQFLKGQNSPADVMDASGLSLLSYAVDRLEDKVCETLIAWGADPFAPNNTVDAS